MRLSLSTSLIAPSSPPTPFSYTTDYSSESYSGSRIDTTCRIRRLKRYADRFPRFTFLSRYCEDSRCSRLMGEGASSEYRELLVLLRKLEEFLLSSLINCRGGGRLLKKLSFVYRLERLLLDTASRSCCCRAVGGSSGCESGQMNLIWYGLGVKGREGAGAGCWLRTVRCLRGLFLTVMRCRCESCSCWESLPSVVQQKKRLRRGLGVAGGSRCKY